MAQSTNLDLLGGFSETFKLSIAPFTNGTYYDFHNITGHDSIDIDEGDKPIETIPIGGGGRVVKQMPKEDSTVTFEVYPVDMDVVGLTGISQMFRDLQGSWDTTEPMDQTDTRNRDTFLASVLFTDDSAAGTGADDATASATNSMRWSAAHCFMTGYKPNFTEGIFKVSVTFTVPAFTKTGTAKIHECSGDGTALSALTAFNSTNFSPTVAAGTAFTWH